MDGSSLHSSARERVRSSIGNYTSETDQLDCANLECEHKIIQESKARGNETHTQQAIESKKSKKPSKTSEPGDQRPRVRPTGFDANTRRRLVPLWVLSKLHGKCRVMPKPRSRQKPANELEPTNKHQPSEEVLARAVRTCGRLYANEAEALADETDEDPDLKEDEEENDEKVRYGRPVQLESMGG
ncbi:MAG: hypothetical protein Q9198_004767 [Flavoplaca austrocitrina]